MSFVNSVNPLLPFSTSWFAGPGLILYVKRRYCILTRRSDIGRVYIYMAVLAVQARLLRNKRGRMRETHMDYGCRKYLVPCSYNKITKRGKSKEKQSDMQCHKEKYE